MEHLLWLYVVIIINDTIGTVPFVFNPNQVIVGNDTTSSGIGLIFNPPTNSPSLDYDEKWDSLIRALLDKRILP